MKDFQLRNDTKLLFRNDPTADLAKLAAGKRCCLFMAAVLSLSLAACGANNSADSSDTDVSENSRTETSVAEELASRGYQSFVVNYRLRPYTQEEGALDLARAVRFVRKNAEVYGIGENDIAVMGFSAGGILAGEMLLNFDGLVNGTALDADYVPDALDEISADAAADGMIYFFYGRLSVGSTDVEINRMRRTMLIVYYSISMIIPSVLRRVFS